MSALKIVMNLKKKLLQFKTIFPFISHSHGWQVDQGTQVAEMLSYRNSHNSSCENEDKTPACLCVWWQFRGWFGFSPASI